MRKILIIEDEPNIRELVSYNLKSGGFLPLEAEDGISGMEMVEAQKPDLILLDIMLPGQDGYEICKELRSAGNKTPIIMMTAKTDEVDKVLGLEFGADDYISKPFGVRELMARIKAVLRRFEGNVGEEQIGEILKVQEISIDIDRHEVTVEGRKVDLTMKEFEQVVWENPAFYNGGQKPNWNIGDCAEFIKWHQKSAAHHNYVVGAAIVVKKSAV